MAESKVIEPVKTGFEDKTSDELQNLLESEKDGEVKEKIVREALARAHRAEGELKKGREGGIAQPEHGAKDNEEIPYRAYKRLESLGCSDDDIDKLVSEAKEAGIPVTKYVTLPRVVAGIEAQQKKGKVASRTFPPDRRVSGGGGNAPRSEKNEKDSPGTASGRDAFNRNLSGGGEESSE